MKIKKILIALSFIVFGLAFKNFIYDTKNPVESQNEISLSSLSVSHNLSEYLYFESKKLEINQQNIDYIIRNTKIYLSLVKDEKRPTEKEIVAKKYPLFLMKDSDLSDKKAKKALEYLLQLAQSFKIQVDPQKVEQFNEVFRAMEHSVIPPAKSEYTLGEVIAQFYRRLFVHPELKGERSAAPKDFSLFWSEPNDIENKDLHLGFNRQHMLLEKYESCKFAEAKTGYGVNPGMTLECDKDLEIKIKFNEVNTEPFGTRIFWALGYNVDPVDYLPELKIKYDRKILTELNNRDKSIDLKATLFGKTIIKKPIRVYHDPLKFILKLVLKNGEVITQNKIANFLFFDTDMEKKENFEKNYRLDNEKLIDHVITVPLQVQLSNKDFVKIGPWSFDDFDHYNRQEMRGLLLLAAWLNWVDIRADNNRLTLVKDLSGQYSAKMFINDLGGLWMGKLSMAAVIKNPYNHHVDYFPESFTKRTRKGFRLTHAYETVDNVEAFNDATESDMKWMAQYMMKLKPEQITQALVASGYTEYEVINYTKKLLKRRDQMMKDLYGKNK
jgi:hypothetical protein